MIGELLLFAAGRGDDPGGISGVIIIVAIVVAVAVLGFAGHWLVHRFGRTRPEVQERRPHRKRRVGRIGS
jgi:hypothetical protein